METVRGNDTKNPTSFGPDNDSRPRLHEPVSSTSRSVFPDGARARIYQPCRSAMTAAKPRKVWRLVFERATSPFIEPLMGYTGGRETLNQVELNFPTLEAAVRYAARQGLRYVVQSASPESRAEVGSRQASGEKQAFSEVVWQRPRSSQPMALARAQAVHIQMALSEPEPFSASTAEAARQPGRSSQALAL